MIRPRGMMPESPSRANSFPLKLWAHTPRRWPECGSGGQRAPTLCERLSIAVDTLQLPGILPCRQGLRSPGPFPRPNIFRSHRYCTVSSQSVQTNRKGFSSVATHTPCVMRPIMRGLRNELRYAGGIGISVVVNVGWGDVASSDSGLLAAWQGEIIMAESNKLCASKDTFE
jgi:hypothetical protein